MKALFLDRDGVINVEKAGSYIFNSNELEFYPGALKAIAKAQDYFDVILVVTNQRGIGKGLMTIADLDSIHNDILLALKDFGGRIDKFYFAPSAITNDELRKPNTGMALLAKNDFPELDFSQSIMIGNNLSDMEFGKKMGMKTIFLHTTQDKIALPNDLIDSQFDSLYTWSNQL